MTLRVVTAGLGAAWEASLVQACRRQPTRAEVVQRCYDLADLLGTVAAGTAQVAVVADGLRWLDHDAVDALAGSGIGVVAVAAPGDRHAERRLRQLGIVHVASAEDDPERLLTLAEAAANTPEVPEPQQPAVGTDTGGDTSRVDMPSSQDSTTLAGDTAPGHLIVVWGPKGAPGRTTVAVNLAVEAARAGVDTLLVDADTYGGAIAQLLGLLDECPGLAWAARLIARGELDNARLRRDTRRTAPDGPHVLTGLPRPELWTELRPALCEHLLGRFRGAFQLTVLDVGFCLEDDEELLYDQVRFRRNAVACQAVQQADVVVAVTRADPIGLHDFIRGFHALQALGVPADRTRVVVNQLRNGLFGGDPVPQIQAALARYLGVEAAAYVPYDRAAVDAATLVARALAEACPTSPARQALADLTRSLLGIAPPKVRRWARRRTAHLRTAGVTVPSVVGER